MKLTSEKLNLTINTISNVLIYGCLLAFLYSVSPLYAKLIGGLAIINYVSKILYLYEVTKREEEAIQALINNVYKSSLEQTEHKNDQNKTH